MNNSKHISGEQEKRTKFSVGRSFTHFRHKLASGIVSLIYGRSMYISPLSKGALAGCVIYWFFEDGVRKFILVKENKDGATARFVSCLGLGDSKDMSAAVQSTSKSLLGKVFYRSMDKNLLATDRVASVPAFSCVDHITGEKSSVQSMVWAVQITKEQAEMCASDMKGVEIVVLPEFALLGPSVAGSHQIIYQSTLRHIHGSQPLMEDLGIDQLEELLKGASSSPKTIH